MSTNDFSAVFATVFGGMDQNIKHLTVFEKLRGMEAHNALAKGGMGKRYTFDGTTEGKARRNRRGKANKIQTFAEQAVTLDIDQDFEYSFTQNQFDAKLYQNAGDFLARKYEDAEKQLHRAMDGDFLGGVLSFLNPFDKKNLTKAGADAGVGIDLTNAATLPRRVLAQAKAFAAQKAGTYQDISHVVSPEVLAEYEEVAVASGFNYADSVLNNGFLGIDMQGVSFYVSQYVTHKLIVDVAGTPTAGQTFDINGITMTAVSTIGSTPGNILIGANAEAFIDNVVAFLADPTVTTATGVAFDEDSDEAAGLEGFSGAKAAADELEITSKRGMIIHDFSGLTNATAADNQTALCYFSKPGQIDLANPIAVTPFVRPASTNSDENYFVEAAWGVAVRKEAQKTGAYVLYQV